MFNITRVYFKNTSQDTSSTELKKSSALSARFCRPVQDATLRWHNGCSGSQRDSNQPPEIPAKRVSLRRSVKTSLRPKGFSSAQPLRPNRALLGASGADLPDAYKTALNFCLSYPSWSASSPPSTTFSSSLSLFPITPSNTHQRPPPPPQWRARCLLLTSCWLGLNGAPTLA
ncbi:hypothetical protein SCHPADRAFT_384293 [Schizopora paradoxa]|uniref:Uncharacterized protein n=1 Tax=Schizopora paradoxa TaxID=27342 RepID=A0A0H2RM40_9AGAM|nr:hypothetical protein SCHPADRAFT_384293 [Schizopora paradoxa]